MVLTARPSPGSPGPRRSSACTDPTTALLGKSRVGRVISMLALQLLQSALVHVNTLLLERVLSDGDPIVRRTMPTDAD